MCVCVYEYSAMVRQMIKDAGSINTNTDFDYSELSVFIAYQPVPHDPNHVRNVSITIVSGDADIARLRLNTDTTNK